MAKFLTTSAITYELEEIIKNALEQLVIISPYLKVNVRIKELLEEKDKDRIDIRVIYGKNELQPEQSIWLDELEYVRTSFRKNLHAKCYLNENDALVTSMNLYEFSQQNNDEMGILVSRTDEDGLYEEIRKEAKRIEKGSQGVRLTVPIVDDEPRSEAKGTRKPTRTKAPSTSKAPVEAFCIRCGTNVPARPLEPYCKRHFASWNRYKNEDYEEEHCHTCGKEHKATMKKPVCLSCYRKYKDVLEFAAS